MTLAQPEWFKQTAYHYDLPALPVQGNETC